MTQSQSGTSRASQEPFLNQLELACVYDILTEISFFLLVLTGSEWWQRVSNRFGFSLLVLTGF